MRAAIGLDIGGTWIRGARVGADGTILTHRQVATPGGIEAAAAAILDLAVTLAAGGPSLAVGIGVPGRVDAERGRILSGGFLDLSSADLPARLTAATRLPVAVENDATMALVAEAAVGAARGCGSAVLLTIGTGIGGAILAAGRILRGRGAAGQLGHVSVMEAGEPCLCGRRGCVETTSSGTALQRLTSAAGRPGASVQSLLAAAATGDAAAAALLDRWAEPLRRAVDSLVAVCDPEVVLLGGGLGAAAHAALARHPAASSWFHCPLRPAALGDGAGVIGAAIAGLGLLAEVPAAVPP